MHQHHFPVTTCLQPPSRILCIWDFLDDDDWIPDWSNLGDENEDDLLDWKELCADFAPVTPLQSAANGLEQTGVCIWAHAFGIWKG